MHDEVARWQTVFFEQANAELAHELAAIVPDQIMQIDSTAVRQQREEAKADNSAHETDDAFYVRMCVEALENYKQNKPKETFEETVVRKFACLAQYNQYSNMRQDLIQQQLNQQQAIQDLEASMENEAGNQVEEE